MRQTNLNAIEIQETGTNRRLGVFAVQDWPKGHKIIIEDPAISCIHWHGQRTISKEWQKLSTTKQQELQSCFRKLRYLPIGSKKPLQKKDRQRLERFVKDYAFWDPRRSKAHIFKLTSHINHACISCANAQHWTDSASPFSMTVTLVRPVKAGEEIFVHYNRSNISFSCAVCPDNSLKSRLLGFGKTIWGHGRDKLPSASIPAPSISPQSQSRSSYYIEDDSVSGITLTNPQTP